MNTDYFYNKDVSGFRLENFTGERIVVDYGKDAICVEPGHSITFPHPNACIEVWKPQDWMDQRAFTKESSDER